MSEDVPTLRPWQRWLFVFAMLGGGLTMLWLGLSEFIALVGDLRTLPPVVIVTTDMAAFVPLGFGIAAGGLLGVFPPPQASIAGRPRRSRPKKGELDRQQIVVLTMLVCLLAYPVLAIALRVVTDTMLTRRGYAQQIVDPGFRAHYLTIRWTRTAGSRQPPG